MWLVAFWLISARLCMSSIWATVSWRTILGIGEMWLEIFDRREIEHGSCHAHSTWNNPILSTMGGDALYLTAYSADYRKCHFRNGNAVHKRIGYHGYVYSSILVNQIIDIYFQSPSLMRTILLLTNMDKVHYITVELYRIKSTWRWTDL